MSVAAETMLKLCKDEEKLKDSVTKVVEIIEHRLNEMGVTSQDRIRDTIRSEAFSTVFRERIMSIADTEGE